MRRLLPIAIFVLLAATLARAAAPDPFPNQPGALSQEETRAVMEAMMSQLGGEKPLPLIASGKRAPDHFLPAYALFAAPVADYSDRVKTRRQVICNFMKTTSGWQCTKPQTEFRMTAQGIAHVFTHVVDSGPENPKDAVEVADYLYSGCFAARFKAIGGANAPVFNLFPITAVVSDRSGFTVRTGPDEAPDVYRVERAELPGCQFTIQYARLGKAGRWLPAGYEAVFQEQARKEAERHKKEEAERVAGLPTAPTGTFTPPPARGHRLTDTLTDASFGLGMGAGLLTLVVPFFMLARGRKDATLTAVALAGTCAVSLVAFIMLLQYVPGPDRGYEVLLLVLTAILSALACLGWVVALAFQKRQG